MKDAESFRLAMLFGSCLLIIGNTFPTDMVWGLILLMMVMFLVTTYDKLKEDWQKYKAERDMQ